MTLATARQPKPVPPQTPDHPPEAQPSPSDKILSRLADDSNRTFTAVRSYRYSHRPKFTVKGFLRRFFKINLSD